MDLTEEDLLLSLVGTICVAAAAMQWVRRKKRRYKTRIINRSRNTQGFDKTTFLPMKEHDADEFFAYTRMNVTTFNKLMTLIAPAMRSRRHISDAINQEMRLAITLQYVLLLNESCCSQLYYVIRYLSQGVSMRSLAWSYQVGRATVHEIIKEVCAAIWQELSPIYLKEPSMQEWKHIADEFFTKWNFPHCIGALDGKHIQIAAPAHSGSLFFNYKSTFSIVLMALCDANYVFRCVDVGAYGSQHDGGVFASSAIGQRFEQHTMNVPADECIVNTNITMPYVIVADEAFPLKKYILRPYPGRQLNLIKRIFNYRLSRARRVIENTFGILVARWRILKTSINADVNNIDGMVKAVVCLHNFCKLNGGDTVATNRYCPPGYVDAGEDEDGAWRNEVQNLPSVGRLAANNARRENYRIRDVMAEYFQSATGMVPWQVERVTRGRTPT